MKAYHLIPLSLCRKVSLTEERLVARIFGRVSWNMDELMRLLSVILPVLQFCHGVYAVERVTNGSLRLIDGLSDTDGKVQIYHNGRWGFVCTDKWDRSDGEVVCRQLGYIGVYRAYEGELDGILGNRSRTIWLDEVECLGTEQRLADCPHDPWGVQDCGYGRDAAVTCMVTNHTEEGSVRLVGGPSANQGRVEFYNFGEWGTVCDDGWDFGDAAVVCRQLGFPGAQFAFSESLFGRGRGRIWLRDVRCSGAEERLSECPRDPWTFGNYICDHGEDAGVRCLENSEPADGTLRLRNGSFSNEGRLEVYHDSEWGTVCDNHWGLAETKVACRQLGYKGAEGFSLGAAFGKGSGQVWLDMVDCKGNENRLDDCSHSGWALSECTHEKDVGVTCSRTEEGDVRLAGGNGDAHGRVEIYYQGIWGTVCKNGWSKYEADSTCRGLGYDQARRTLVSGVPGGTDLILMENVTCSRFGRGLRFCDFPGWGVHNNCTHDDDVAIQCGNKGLLSGGQIAGIVLGCVGFFLAVCKGCCFCCKDSDGNEVIGPETVQTVEEPASGKPVSPEPNEADQPPPSYDEINKFPDAGGDTRL